MLCDLTKNCNSFSKIFTEKFDEIVWTYKFFQSHLKFCTTNKNKLHFSEIVKYIHEISFWRICIPSHWCMSLILFGRSKHQFMLTGACISLKNALFVLILPFFGSFWFMLLNGTVKHETSFAKFWRLYMHPNY